MLEHKFQDPWITSQISLDNPGKT